MPNQDPNPLSDSENNLSDSPPESENELLVPKPSEKTKKKIQTTPVEENVPRGSNERTVEEEAAPYLLGCAQLSTNALTTEWTLGTNRAPNETQIRALVKSFKRNLYRSAPENNLLLICKKEDYNLGMETLLKLKILKTPTEGYQDLTLWAEHMPGHKFVVAAGQHRMLALEKFLTSTAGKETKNWWNCRIYDEGAQSHCIYKAMLTLL
jgi:hypothetical protein